MTSPCQKPWDLGLSVLWKEGVQFIISFCILYSMLFGIAVAHLEKLHSSLIWADCNPLPNLGVKKQQLAFARLLGGHLQTDLCTLNVKMMGRGYPRDVNVQKCMHKPTFLVKIVTLEGGRGFSA